MLTGVQLGFPLPPAFFLAGMPVTVSTAAKPICLGSYGSRQRTAGLSDVQVCPTLDSKTASAIQHLTVDASAGQVLRRQHLELHPLGDPCRVDAPRLLAVPHERLDGDLG